MASADCDVKTVVYRYYGDDFALLYVGISNDFERRDMQHLRDPWRHEVLFCHVMEFPDRREAIAAEETAIQDERPKHNVRAWAGHARQATGGKETGWFVVLNCDEAGNYLPPEPCDPPTCETTARTYRERMENVETQEMPE